MEVMTQNQDGVAVVQVTGRLDANSTGDLEKTVLSTLDSGADRLLIDVADLDYINSSGLRIMVMAYQRLKQSGGKLAISGVKDYILEVFTIAGYDRLFLIYPDRDKALAEL